MEAIQEWGIELIRFIQQLSPALDSPMELFTFMGTIEFYMLFVTFLYWVVDPQIGFRVFLALLFNDLVSSSFKQLLHQPRPYWVGDVQALSAETSYGLPSSHSSGSLAVWTYLAYQVKKRWLWIAAIALFLLISFSRLYLGVHFPQDVLFGWLIGFCVVFFFAKYGDRFGGWFNQLGIKAQIGFAFGISVLFGLTGILIKAVISATPDPASWASFSTEARTITGNFTLAGALFGSVLGYILMKKYAPFKAQGSWLQKAGRYLIGIVGVIVILYGLDPLFALLAVDETALGYVLRYVRYGTATFWAMLGAPWLFLKLKLANK